MAEDNRSRVSDFILVGLTDDPELQVMLFAVFLVIYLSTAIGNLGLIVLIQVSPQLHTPMYFFLSHLAFVDFCYTSSVTPNTVINFLREQRSINFYACATQVCCFITFAVCEMFLLSIMAYDRYMAIWNPLLYAVLMPRKLCLQLIASTYVYGFTVGIAQAVATFSLSFCGSNVVNHFYCDDVPLVALACSDTQVKELMLLIIAGFNTLCSLVIVVISYVFIVFAIMRIHSADGRKKAFSTCASHLTSITIFYGTVSFMYLQPKSSHSLNTDKFASVFVLCGSDSHVKPTYLQLEKSGGRVGSLHFFKMTLTLFDLFYIESHSSVPYPIGTEDLISASILTVAPICVKQVVHFMEYICITPMAEDNRSRVSDFILVGLTDDPELQVMLFAVFLVIYLSTVIGNLGLIVLIQVSPQLHTSMYFFLSHLAFVDFCYTSSVTPNTVINFLREQRSINFYACATQVCCFITFVVCEMFLLSIMAYDRYMAIWNPLLYAVLMPRKLCLQLIASTYVYGFTVGIAQAVATFSLSFCGSNVVNHFYCDDVPLVALACSDTQVKELMLLIIAGFNTLCSLIIVVISYVFIVFAIMRIHSADGRKKAFSTCASHLTSITIFYGTVSFMYLQPKSSHSLNTDKFASVFYVVVIPMLNPLIYSLRNQEVKSALKRITYKLFLSMH
ncbi:olfactory receptor 5AL1-like [Sigmodon hispidus]